MSKVALLIGVSEYGAGLNPLPKAVDDIRAMRAILENPDLGGFTDVKELPNPDPFMMQLEIERLFSDRSRDDLILLFFSGHGVKDDSGNLYFGTSITRKNSEGELIKATAVPARFVHDIMSNSRSRRQVVILDCCFSGAFAQGLAAKDDGTVNIKEQLGGEGRVVLTSSASTQYSFEDTEADLSVYTRYLVEGIRSGAADNDNDGMVAVEELHEYAKRKVQEAAPAMKPKIYAVEEGFRILLTKSPRGDPALVYRKEVERCASHGMISAIGRRILDELRDSLHLSKETAQAIETEVFQPYREYQTKLHTYEQALREALQVESPPSEFTWQELNRYQEVLGLRKQDVAPIQQRLLGSPPKPPLKEATESPSRTASPPSPTPPTVPAHEPTPPPLSPPLQPVVAGGGAIAAPLSGLAASHPHHSALPIIAGVLSVAIVAAIGGFWAMNLWTDRTVQSPAQPGSAPNAILNGEPSAALSPQEAALNRAIKARTRSLGIDEEFFNELVDGSFYTVYPDLIGKEISNRREDRPLRDDWRSRAESWLNKLEAHMSPEARANLGRYTLADANVRKDAVLEQKLSPTALNDMTDAKFFSLFPGQNRAAMEDPDFIDSNMGQIWHGLASDELRQVLSGESLTVLSLAEAGEMQVSGRLTDGEGMAYIFNLPEGPDQLWVSLSAPPEAAQLSVYPPKLNEAGPILEDSRQLIVSTPLFQSGFYEVVVVSTRERPFEFTLSLRLERAEPVSPVQPVEPVAPILITP